MDIFNGLRPCRQPPYLVVKLCCCVAMWLCCYAAMLLCCYVAMLLCCCDAVLRCWTLQAVKFPTCESDLQYPDEFHATLTGSGLRKIKSRSVKADLNPGEDYMVKAFC